MESFRKTYCFVFPPVDALLGEKNWSAEFQFSSLFIMSLSTSRFFTCAFRLRKGCLMPCIGVIWYHYLQNGTVLFYPFKGMMACNLWRYIDTAIVCLERKWIQVNEFKCSLKNFHMIFHRSNEGSQSMWSRAFRLGTFILGSSYFEFHMKRIWNTKYILDVLFP